MSPHKSIKRDTSTTQLSNSCLTSKIHKGLMKVTPVFQQSQKNQ